MFRLNGFACLFLLVSGLSPCALAADEARGTLPVFASREVGGEEQTVGENETGGGLEIGIAYARLDSGRKTRKTAEVFGELNLSAVTHDPAPAAWGRMQRSLKSGIDFDELDLFVEAYHEAGFRDLTIVLDASRSREETGTWVPGPDSLDAYAAWVGAVVERYDADGFEDQPGLRQPVLRYQIGHRFDGGAAAEEYLRMLDRGARAARAVCENVELTPAGFFVTPAFLTRPSTPEEVEAAFAAADPVLPQPLAALRQVLDRPDLFDLVNLEARGGPFEIEDTMAWIRAEMSERDYTRPVLLGHASTTPFMAWGAVTEGKGVVVPPATEEDRLRLASYFSRLIDKDDALLPAAHRFAAADQVKKIAVAAEQGVQRIRLAGMHDLEAYTKKGGQAAAGNAAWGGMVDLAGKRRRPALFALDQVVNFLRDYDEVVRIPTQHDRVRVYEVRKGKDKKWIAWVEPESFVLPGGRGPQFEVDVPIIASHIVVERLAVGPNPLRKTLPTRKGAATVTLTREPAFLFTQF